MGGIHRWRMVRGMVEDPSYLGDFLVLINLHVHVRGTNHLMPEVNYFQKLRPQVIINNIDRSQAVESTTESTCVL